MQRMLKAVPFLHFSLRWDGSRRAERTQAQIYQMNADVLFNS